MINHVFSVICDKSSIDSETNKVSILEVLEQLIVFTDQSERISLPIQFELFSLWTRAQFDKPAQGQMRIHFCNPSGVCKVQAEVAIDLSSVLFYRTRFRANGIELVGPGVYKFVVELKPDEKTEWVEVAQLPLWVTYQIPPDKEKPTN
jgi:hypothetical protein